MQAVVLSTGEWVLAGLDVAEHRSRAQMSSRPTRVDMGGTRGLQRTGEGSCVRRAPVHRAQGWLALAARPHALRHRRERFDRSRRYVAGVETVEHRPSERQILHPPLNSGNLLLVKHGPLEKATGRSHLMAFVSTDDGRSWDGGLSLDERSGVSYPDGQQTPDGLIRIIYDFSRTGTRHILMAAFREEDVTAGKLNPTRPACACW